MDGEKRIQDHAGQELLKYLRGHEGVDINEIELNSVPSHLLHQYPGTTSPASIAVHMLLDDKRGVYVRHFNTLCEPYKQGRKCRDIGRLKQTFQRFVNDVLFRQERNISKTPPPRERENLHEVTDREKAYIRLHDIVDLWGEKSAELMESVENFIRKLEHDYTDPCPESWGVYDYDDGYDGYITTAPQHEEIPNRYLDILGRVLCVFDEQIKVLEKSIDKKNPKSPTHEPVLEDLGNILYVTLRMKKLPWKSLGDYFYTRVSILRQMEGIIHRINAIQYRLK